MLTCGQGGVRLFTIDPQNIQAMLATQFKVCFYLVEEDRGLT